VNPEPKTNACYNYMGVHGAFIINQRVAVLQSVQTLCTALLHSAQQLSVTFDETNDLEPGTWELVLFLSLLLYSAAMESIQDCGAGYTVLHTECVH